MRIGLAGAGRIGAFHAETLRGLPGIDGVVIADADADAARARAVAGKVGAEVVDGVEELSAAGVAGVVVATTVRAWTADAAPPPDCTGMMRMSLSGMPGAVASRCEAGWH